MKNLKYHNILEFNIILSKIKNYLKLDRNNLNLDDYNLDRTLDDIRYELEEVDEASKLIYRYGSIPIYFNSDIKIIFDKANKFGVLNEEELLELIKYFSTIKNIGYYAESLSNNNIEHIYLQKNIDNLIYHKDLSVRLSEIINPYGEILDTASSNLKSIRQRIYETKRNIQNKLNEILSRYSSYLSETIVTTRNDRYVIPVKNDFKNSIKGAIYDTSNSGGTVYIEPAVINELNNKLNSLVEEEKEEIFVILRTYSLKLRDYYDELVNNYNILLHLDLIYAKAHYGNEINGNKVKINDEGLIELYNCHHPLLNVKKIIDNDIFLGRDYQGIIITGPNTGGKTVLLKTIGLLSLMVKFSLLVPASEESNLMIFDDVYADIGDDQDISQNLSTFSSHMKNVIEIMNNVTNKSLVLLDEVGSGTDPVEGSSLAIAIFDTLIEKKCLIVATSHYSELKIHAFNRSDIINASVEFDSKTLKPTYRLLIGVPGQSNALYISKILGLDNEVIEKAKSYTRQNRGDLDIALRKLIHQSENYSKLIDKNKAKKAELDELINNQKELIKETEAQRVKILNEATEDAKKFIEKSRDKITNLINDLEEMKLKEVKLHEISDKKHELRQIKESFDIIEENDFDEYDINIGDDVKIVSYGLNGKVKEVAKNNKYIVVSGNATLTVSKDDLRKIKVINNKTTLKPSPQTNSIEAKKDVSFSLDLRGKRYEDAKILLEKYLDDCLFSGIKVASIIHGFGTGTIRTLVHNELKTNKNVSSFRYGGQNEGGQGATIVYFK